MSQLENIIDLAACMAVETGKDIETCLFEALKKDTEKCLSVIDDISDMKKGYINELNPTQKAFKIIEKRTHLKLSTL